MVPKYRVDDHEPERYDARDQVRRHELTRSAAAWAQACPSAARISSTVGAATGWWPSIARRTDRAMSRNRILPARNCSTAPSLLALRTAGIVRPAASAS